MSLQDAHGYAQAGEYAKAWPIVSGFINEEPDNPVALNIACYMLERQGNAGLAYNIAKRLSDRHPSAPVAWVNLGKTCDTLWRMEEAENAYRRALTQVKAGDSDTKLTIFCNLSALQLQLGNFKQAEKYADQALQVDPSHLKSRHNKGICLLARGAWSDGWKQYEASVGSPQRIAYQYNNEPTWKGEPGTVVVFGEQGIGDEICAASMIPDAIKRARVIIDCDARLETLFRRSFPEAKVYGTRSAKVLNWAEEDQAIDYSIPSMQMGALFRNEAQDFPGTPYLKADPDRVLMWKALWASKKKPVFGIAWTGGLKETASQYRQWGPEELKAITGLDATWVSLQYKDTETPENVLRFAETTSKNYDDTAALVASLDGVVAMQSTAVHIAGALGIPCAAGIPKTSQWRYGEAGDAMPWYRCVRLFRQEKLGDWSKAIQGIQGWLK